MTNATEIIIIAGITFCIATLCSYICHFRVKPSFFYFPIEKFPKRYTMKIISLKVTPNKVDVVALEEQCLAMLIKFSIKKTPKTTLNF
jgi:hypothetical protein